MQKISVVIPTRNRYKNLLLTLKSLESQTLDRESFEVIIVNNDSSDLTDEEVKAFKKNTPLNLIYLSSSRVSASCARNFGIKHSNHKLILNTDDDTVPCNNLLAEHVKSHANLGFANDIAILGYTTWHNSIRITNFMKLINDFGPQFGYGLVEDDTDLPFNYFYSSNISISKSFLMNNGLFDEDFPEYWYDIELGYRLKQRGLKIMLNREAITYHLHPTSILSFLKRQKKVGYYASLFYQKYPELKDFLLLLSRRRKNGNVKMALLYRIYSLFINMSYKKGLKSGSKDFCGNIIK